MQISCSIALCLGSLPNRDAPQAVEIWDWEEMGDEDLMMGGSRILVKDERPHCAIKMDA